MPYVTQLTVPVQPSGDEGFLTGVQLLSFYQSPFFRGVFDWETLVHADASTNTGTGSY